MDCTSERVLVWAGVDGDGLAGEDVVSAVEDVGGAVCVCVVVGGQGVKGPECHIELDEGNGAVEREDSEIVEVGKDGVELVAVGGVGDTITVEVTHSVDAEVVVGVSVSGGGVAVTLVDSVDAVVVMGVRVSVGGVSVSDDKVNVEVVYSVDAVEVIGVSVSAVAEAVSVSDDTVTVRVIYSVDAEAVIEVSVSVGNELVWSPPGVLTDEACVLHPWETVPVPQWELTLEALPYGGVANGTEDGAVELGVPIGKLVALPSVAVLLGVSVVLVKMGTGGAVAVTVTVITIWEGMIWAEDVETLAVALLVGIGVPVGPGMSISEKDDVGDGKSPGVLLGRVG